MNYDYSKIQDRYNEIMFDERDVIATFLKEQYDVRYGKQRDTWHFEPAVEVVAHNGSLVQIHDIKLDSEKAVVFYVEAFCECSAEWECFDFAYGELGKVIEALPDVDEILLRNAKTDLIQQTYNIRLDLLLGEQPFTFEVDGKFHTITDVLFEDGELKLLTALNNDNEVPNIPKRIFVDLRDYINILLLHKSKEYERLMGLLALQDNLSYCPADFGLATFVPQCTDMTFDVSSVHRDDNGNLVIYGFDIDDEKDEKRSSLITLKERDIKPQYLTSIIELIENDMYSDVIDTRNAHNAELVRKINAAWKNQKYHDRFQPILYAMLMRDYGEYEDTFGSIPKDADFDWAMEHAHEIMENIGDDWDLKTILSFIRFEE